MKKYLVATLALAMTFTAGTALAFHSGGVAECEGCHTMHNSLDGAAMDTDMAQYQSGVYLLQGNGQSGNCLNCHEHAGDTGPSSYHISTADADMPDFVTAPKQLTPGGDFGWLRKDYTFAVRGATNTNWGFKRGHNIISDDNGYVADADKTVAPGGGATAYDATQLHCSSCHDPHGKYRRNADGTFTTTGLAIKASGSYNTSPDPDAAYSVGAYRILAGVGYSPKSLGGAHTFANDPPNAVAPSTYNRTEATTETVVAYGSGMSEWCANCHAEMLENAYVSGNPGHVHPAGDNAFLSASIADFYNDYVKSGDMTGTGPSNGLAGYSSLVPFELGGGSAVADYTTLKSKAVNNGSEAITATTSNTVSCLSCHRVHASGYESMLRFPHANEFMINSGDPATYPVANSAQGQGLDPALSAKALYDRPATVFSGYQRLLCNKCHAKD